MPCLIGFAYMPRDAIMLVGNYTACAVGCKRLARYESDIDARDV